MNKKAEVINLAQHMRNRSVSLVKGIATSRLEQNLLIDIILLKYNIKQTIRISHVS